jgi:hypothetical protein
VGFVVDKEALGQVFSEHFGFPLLIIPPAARHSPPSIIRALQNRPVVAFVLFRPKKKEENKTKVKKKTIPLTDFGGL